MSFVISTVEIKARHRTPDCARDEATRLAMLAESTVDNGGPEETAAFGRELLASMER